MTPELQKKHVDRMRKSLDILNRLFSALKQEVNLPEGTPPHLDPGEMTPELEKALALSVRRTEAAGRADAKALEKLLNPKKRQERSGGARRRNMISI